MYGQAFMLGAGLMSADADIDVEFKLSRIAHLTSDKDDPRESKDKRPVRWFVRFKYFCIRTYLMSVAQFRRSFQFLFVIHQKCDLTGASSIKGG